MSSQKATTYLILSLVCLLLLSSSVSAAFEAQEFFSYWVGKYASFITGRGTAPDTPTRGSSGGSGTQGSSSYNPTASPRIQAEGGIVVVSEETDGTQRVEVVRPSFRSVTRTLTPVAGGGGSTEPALADLDGDGIPDIDDNCPTVINPQQSDCDGDLTGDACDNDFPQNCAGSSSDTDGDGVDDGQDNCPFAFNPDQIDEDGDGAGDSCDICPSHRLHDEDGDGALNNACIGGTDCTDQNSAIYPGALELCDSVDNNCNGLIDESGCLTCDIINRDNDPSNACRDCNDNDYSVYNDAPEICWDFKDNDCDGKKDCDDDACTGDTTCLRRCDADRDTYQSISCGGADCNDNDALTYPSAPERVDSLDNDCNGQRDDLPLPLPSSLQPSLETTQTPFPLVQEPLPPAVNSNTVLDVSSRLEQMVLRLREINGIIATLENTHPQEIPHIRRHTQRMTVYTSAVLQDLRGGDVSEVELRRALQALRRDISQLHTMLESLS